MAHLRPGGASFGSFSAASLGFGERRRYEVEELHLFLWQEGPYVWPLGQLLEGLEGFEVQEHGNVVHSNAQGHKLVRKGALRRGNYTFDPLQRQHLG
jgi:hypothetical protein|tara:strand:+ start:281 stop:571 length:291 start_codon:yes stop_codon:yes gene_type:complete